MTFGGAVFDFLTLFSFCLFTNKKGGKFQNLNIKIDLFFEKSVEKSIVISRYYYIYYTEILYGLPEPLRVRLLAKKKKIIVVSFGNNFVRFYANSHTHSFSSLHFFLSMQFSKVFSFQLFKIENVVVENCK